MMISCCSLYDVIVSHVINFLDDIIFNLWYGKVVPVFSHCSLGQLKKLLHEILSWIYPSHPFSDRGYHAIDVRYCISLS